MTKNLLLILLATMPLTACLGNSDEEDITERFNLTWNTKEYLVRGGDGSITYNAIAWGGLAAHITEDGTPVDWSEYGKLVVEFSEPTQVPTQMIITDHYKVYGADSIERLECSFDGQDVTAIKQVALQASQPTTLRIKRVYLSRTHTLFASTPIWEGDCELGNWAQGVNIGPEHFINVTEGDRLELIYTTDQSNPLITYWQLRTIYSGTDTSLEGNARELNSWGCATVSGGSTNYRITLTANDVKLLQEVGLFVNGYFCHLREINMLQ